MFILKSTHAALMAERERTAAWLLAEYNRCNQERLDWQRRYDDLLTRYTAPPPEKPAPERKPAREPDEVDTAIEWKAQGDTGIRRYLSQYARAERRKGTDPKEIAERILKGENASEDDGVPEE